MRRKTVAIIGDGHIEQGGDKFRLACSIGKALIDNGYRIQSGGLGGIMEAVFIGAHSSEKYREGDTVAIIPSYDAADANPYADIVIPTGMDIHRNGVVINADAVVAIGGGVGTLSEMAFAWSNYRLLIGATSVEGWSKRLAGRNINYAPRYDFDDDIVFPAETADDVIRILAENIDRYTKVRKAI